MAEVCTERNHRQKKRKYENYIMEIEDGKG
jgi:hypothetical protein